MTNEDWKKVEESLMNFYSPVELQCDQYLLTLSLERITQYKNAIVFFVDGKFNGGWLIKDCEERRRFCREIHKSVYTTKQKKEYKKLGKRFLKEMNLDPDKKFTYYTYNWISFSSLKRHLIKNNVSIQWRENE